MAHMVPIFKAGNHVSRDGRALTFTTSDLDRIVTTYNSQPADSRHDAPAVIGHPKTDGPAYGWFNSIKRDGEILYGELRDPHPDFVGWVKDGRYRKVSAKFDADGLLKHVGWLGAQPPAIKGLDEFTFEEGEGPEYEVGFSEDEINDIEDSTSTSSEAIMPDPTAGTTPAKETPAEQTKNVTAVAADGSVVSSTEFAEYKAQQDAETKKLREDLAVERDKTQTLEFGEYLNKRITKVTPANRALVMRIMKQAANVEGTYEFAEGEVMVKATLLDDIKKLVESLPDSTSLEEVATDGEPQGEEFSEGSPIAAEIDRLAAKATGTTTLNGGAR